MEQIDNITVGIAIWTTESDLEDRELAKFLKKELKSTQNLKNQIWLGMVTNSPYNLRMCTYTYVL